MSEIKMNDSIIVVERDNSEIWKNLSSLERTPILKYHGFDCVTRWPMIDKLFNEGLQDFGITTDLASSGDLEKIIRYVDLFKKNFRKELEILLLSFNKTPERDNANKFLGYDAGVICSGEDPIFFSSILNELRMSGNGYIKNYVSLLNKNYLFNKEQDAVAYLAAREMAVSNGATEYMETAFHTSEFTYCTIHKL
jgi:hypothetical protein